MRLVFSLLLFPLLFFSQQKQKGNEFITLLLIKKEYNSAYNYFSEEMKAQISVPTLEQTVEQLEGQLGKFKNIIDVNNDKNIYFYYSEFEKVRLDIQIAFDNKNNIIGFFFVPHKESGNRNEQGKSFKIKSGGIELNGTLLTPSDNGKNKLVIFIHGSGPQDRDETIYENKPFRDIAEGLLEKGISSYRFDKRTLSNPETFDNNSTVEQETINDVKNIVDYFINDKIYKDYKVILLGHSFGAYLLPKIIEKTNVSKLVYLAANARPLQDIIIEQLEYLNKINNDEVSLEKIQSIKGQVNFLNSKKFNLSASSNDLPLGLSAGYWNYLLDYNPLKIVNHINLPMFFAQGGKDYQVTVTDFNLWKTELKNNRKAEFKFYPSLNHIFMKDLAELPSPKDYKITSKVDSQLISDIADFILR